MSDNQLIDKYNKIRFENFVFDFKTQSLEGLAEDKDLPPKPSEILSLLLSRPGDLITREQIIESVWPEQVVDFDQNINFCIKQIRQALNDEPRAAKFIETVPKKGYRFIADYQPIEKKTSREKTSLVKRCISPFYFDSHRRLATKYVDRSRAKTLLLKLGS